MTVAEILAILRFLIDEYPTIKEYIDEFFALFDDPTDEQMLAGRVAEYVRVATAAWVSVWSLDYGAGEVGNVEARNEAVRQEIKRYAIDWKNEALTLPQIDAIVVTSRGLATLKMGGTPSFTFTRRIDG